MTGSALETTMTWHRAEPFVYFFSVMGGVAIAIATLFIATYCGVH